MSHEDELTLLMINGGVILHALFLRRALDHRIIGITGSVAGAALLICGVWRGWKSRCENIGAIRFLSGECMKCGYSLTGNTSGVCPKCGTEISWPH